MGIFDHFKRSTPPSEDGGIRLRSKSFTPIPSSPEGEFTFYAGENAVSAIEELIGLSLEAMESLPARVLAKCQELGFAHNEPVHFFFEAHEIAHPVWRVGKIVPPIDMGNGTFAERTIHTFLRHGEPLPNPHATRAKLGLQNR
jgi:hypothetical protein